MSRTRDIAVCCWRCAGSSSATPSTRLVRSRPLVEQAADRIAAGWEAKRQLVRVLLREELGYARRAVDPDGNNVAERRVYEVSPYTVEGYQVDAIFKL